MSTRVVKHNSSSLLLEQYASTHGSLDIVSVMHGCQQAFQVRNVKMSNMAFLKSLGSGNFGLAVWNFWQYIPTLAI